MKTKDKYQNVYISLANGQTGLFTGRPLVNEKTKTEVKSVLFTIPKPLPNECSWELLEKEPLPKPRRKRK